MLSLKQLSRLQRAVGARPCLTIYVSTADTDPAAQGAWRRRLQNAGRDERKRVEREAPEELDGFDRAWKLLDERLPAGTGALGSPGWAGFADPDRVLHETALHSSVGTQVSWKRGPRLAPYARALSREHTLLLALVDARKARVFRRVDGRLNELEELAAEPVAGEADQPGMMKAAHSSSGVRGQTRTDAAQRALSVATERLVRLVAKQIAGLADGSSAVVLGGIDRVTLAVQDALPESLRGLVQLRADLRPSMTDAEVTAALGTVLDDTVRQRERELLAFWLESGRSRGLALSGWNSAIRALDEGAVETLLLSTRLLEEQADDAETLIGRVIDAGGRVVELSGEAGEVLDAEGGGIGVCLRFAPSMESA